MSQQKVLVLVGDAAEELDTMRAGLKSSLIMQQESTGSRALSRRSGLGVSPATIRNTMSDLEEKGYLFHPHASAGRVPRRQSAGEP